MFEPTTLPLASLPMKYLLPILCKFRHSRKAGELTVNRPQKLHKEPCNPALCNPLLFAGFSLYYLIRARSTSRSEGGYLQERTSQNSFLLGQLMAFDQQCTLEALAVLLLQNLITSYTEVASFPANFFSKFAKH